MKFGHPNIAFPLVIGKRHINIGHEAQGFLLVVAQALQ